MPELRGTPHLHDSVLGLGGARGSTAPPAPRSASRGGAEFSRSWGLGEGYFAPVARPACSLLPPEFGPPRRSRNL
eukprot:15480391-Alexandrium_andersonii.AAC.1